jgi:hypothetical protein
MADQAARGHLGALARARVRRLRQGGRAVLLWGLAFYVLAAGLLLAALDAWHPGLRETCWLEKWRHLRRWAAREPDRPLLVMLGSSRTDEAFQAEHLDGLPGPAGRPYRAYNLGVPMAGPLHESLYLGTLLDAGVRPRVLLVELLPALFNEPQRGAVSEESWTPARWLSLPQFAHLWPYFTRPCRMGRDWLEARLAPWYAFRLELCEGLAGRLPQDRGGIRTHDRWGCRILLPVNAWFCAWRREVARTQYRPTLGGLHLGAGPRRALRDLVERCRREGIAVVLVLMPESTEFRSWYSPRGLAEVRALLEELGDGCAVVDARAWLPDAAFRDGHHVHAEGARAFTARLREELRPLLEAAP